MKKHKLLSTIFCLVLAANIVVAQSSEAIKEYIAKFKDAAIAEMIRTGVPASITLAQGIHETEAGRSDLVLKSNNHFGIKCKENWTGESVFHDDDARGECFRKYEDPLDSYRDHSDFLKNRSHYAFLFELDPTDYEAWAYGLKKAGYAT
ncbi:MAG: glucosaminidase domain-containing protein, partial [Chitinophagaceae bacterium]|nr:glucosaminidase domain-containing protein [Chitinophagaceae bacterium]